MEFLVLVLVVAIFVFSLQTHNRIQIIERQLNHLIEQLRKTNAGEDAVARYDTPVAHIPVEPKLPRVAEVPQFVVPEEAPEQPAAAPERPEKDPKTPFTRRIEKLIGENLMSKIGALALVVGIGFFVKFAIDNNWINEVARTVLGILVGFGLWGVAYRLRDTYRSFSSVLAGAGFAVCFVTIAVAYNYYDLFSAPVALSILVALVMMLTWIALRYDRRELAVTAVLGGYIAPFLSAGPDGSLITLLGYTALLSAAACFISHRRNWPVIPVVGMVATWIIVAVATFGMRADVYESVATACFCILFYTLFSLPMVAVLRRAGQNQLLFITVIGAVVLNLIAVLYFGIYAMESFEAISKARGIIPLCACVLNGFLYLRYCRRSGGVVADLFRWITIICCAIFVPVQFADFRVVGGLWSVYSLLLAIAYVRYKKGGYLLASFLIALLDWAILCIAMVITSGGGEEIALMAGGACYIALAYQMLRHEDLFRLRLGNRVAVFRGVTLNVGCAFLTWGLGIFVTVFIPCLHNGDADFAVAMAIMAAIAVAWRPDHYTAGFMSLLGVLWLSFEILSVEDYSVVNKAIVWAGVVLLGTALVIFTKKRLPMLLPERQNMALVFFSIIGTTFVIEVLATAVATSGFTSYYSAAFSTSLIIAGAAIMALGLSYRRQVLRTTSLVIFGLLLVKLLAYDLWRLPIVGRIVVFILLGVVLLSLSFFYQKLKDTFFAHDPNHRDERGSTRS